MFLCVLCVYGPIAWNKTDDDDETVRDWAKVAIDH